MKMNKEQRVVLANRITENIIAKNQKITLTDKELKECTKALPKNELKTKEMLESIIHDIDKVLPAVEVIYNNSKLIKELDYLYTNYPKELRNLKDHCTEKIQNIIERKGKELGYINRLYKTVIFPKVEEELIIASIECDDLNGIVTKVTDTITKRLKDEKQ